MEDAGDITSNVTFAPPSHVSLAPFSPCVTPAPRRLSRSFSEPSRPVPAVRKLAWISLQGRLVGGPEATTARTIGGGLSREEAVCWELFSPIHRVLIVAVVAVAAAETKKSRQISQLKKSVDLRDEVLQCMQQKLDDLSQQMNSTKDHFANYQCSFFVTNNKFMADEMSELRGTKFCSCRYHHKLHPENGIVELERKASNGQKDMSNIEYCSEEMFKSPHASIVEQEERRMSDLSDLCSSVTSSIDIQCTQLSMLAAEQDFYNLQKESEEKDVIIKELAASAHASNVASSKRITELEDIIRRKNLVITKLKKDMLFLEQKLMRLRRPSSTASHANDVQLPVMSNNILYDMSSTSPSSSDSDNSAKSKEHRFQGPEASDDHESCQEDSFTVMKSQRPHLAKTPISVYGSMEMLAKQRPVSPLEENHMIHRNDSFMRLRPRQVVSSGLDSKKTKRRSHLESRSTASERRWV